MSDATVRQPALLRGAAAGLLTAALTLAAHGLGGGTVAVGPAAVHVLLVALTVGAVASTLPRGMGAMALLLSAGQLVGHTLLSIAHPHVPAHAQVGPHGAMLVVHLAAVLLGAGLISVGEQLYRALNRVVRRTVAPAAAAMFAAPPRLLAGGDQPLIAELLLATSMSHRGPPIAG
ncbi:MAG: hypothetical protein AB1925_08120 [Actinomycetota bacterium]